MKKYFEEVDGKVKVISEKKLQMMIGKISSAFLCKRMWKHGYSVHHIAEVAERSEREVKNILKIY